MPSPTPQELSRASVEDAYIFPGVFAVEKPEIGGRGCVFAEELNETNSGITLNTATRRYLFPCFVAAE
jgi:hypothetical protein